MGTHAHNTEAATAATKKIALTFQKIRLRVGTCAHSVALMMYTRAQLVKLARAYMAGTGATSSGLSRLIGRHTKLIARLLSGDECMMSSAELASEWFSGSTGDVPNWPFAVPWPDGVPRPPGLKTAQREGARSRTAERLARIAAGEAMSEH